MRAVVVRNKLGQQGRSATREPEAPAKYSSCLAIILPDSKSGATKMSACPATAEAMCLICAAWLETALSNASGPSSKPPLICPRSAILHKAAASSVDGMLGLTVSTAERMATFGVPTPMICANKIAFCTMSAFSAKVGAMFSAASVMYKGLGYMGASKRNTCDMRRPVRKPFCDTTA